ncbi:MAG: hypothetical protein LBC20_16810 [Planctomycetaceae bacterium]|jgi:hypothetical protein|nr:hypothetical protein [Planctomycetaceae bacterium]
MRDLDLAVSVAHVGGIPQTAEIMSKILLLAEDNKIKDPTILDIICNK